MLASVSFRGRPQLRRLLTHLVQYSLAENGDALKEYTLGVEVFDSGSGFDPRCDSIVRVEAFNLRMCCAAGHEERRCHRPRDDRRAKGWLSGRHFA